MRTYQYSQQVHYSYFLLNKKCHWDIINKKEEKNKNKNPQTNTPTHQQQQQQTNITTPKQQEIELLISYLLLLSIWSVPCSLYPKPQLGSKGREHLWKNLNLNTFLPKYCSSRPENYNKMKQKVTQLTMKQGSIKLHCVKGWLKTLLTAIKQSFYTLNYSMSCQPYALNV